MNAIIIPGVTDLNKGDQALVWESVRLVEDTGAFEKVSILSSGDSSDEERLLCGQSQENGYNIIKHILKHPRRGIHQKKDDIQDSKFSFIRQVYYSVRDLISRSFLLKVCRHKTLTRLFYSSSLNSTLEIFKNSDVVFVKGGGFLHAYGEIKAPYVVWYLLFYVRLSLRLGKKVVFLPNSYGPFRGLTVKYQIQRVLNNCHLIYSRESVSAESISALLRKNIPIEKDLGFFLEADIKFDINRLYQKYNLLTDDKVIGITVRPWRFPGHDNPKALYEKYIESIQALIRVTIEKGYKIALCNQSLGPNTHEDDRNAIELVYAGFEDDLRVVWINENLTCAQLKALYGSFYSFVGTRFHSVIFATTALVPSIAIAYGGNKALGIMADIGLDNLVIPIEDITEASINKAFYELELNYDTVVDKLRVNSESLLSSRNRLIDDIKGII